MATLTLTVGASADDAILNDSSYDDASGTMNVGGVGTTPNTNYGQGWRFTSVTLSGADTVTAAYLALMKNGSQWSQMNCRWTAIDEDNTATFSSGSPPGARAIVSASIADDAQNVNQTDGTVYQFPPAGAGRTTLGAAIEAVLNRAGWASGNALGIVCNSDQDASAYQSFARKVWHTYDSATSASEPQLVITYTAGATSTSRQPHRSRALRAWPSARW